jgi:serine/threonine-protein kinase
MVMVQRVVGLPCQQGQQVLLDQKLTVGIQGNPNGTVFGQNPPENTPVPPGTQIVLTCL